MNLLNLKVSNPTRPQRILQKTGSILSWPFTQVFKSIENCPQEARSRSHGYPPKPIPLYPRKLDRSLTLDLGVQGNSHMAQHPYNALLIFPPEIRNMIWEKVVGGMAIHWWIADQKLWGFVCSSGKVIQADCFLGCWILEFESDSRRGLGTMGLLLSCRKFYSEVVNMLYSENVFNIYGPGVLAHLPNLLLPQRINAIQSLRFCWPLGAPPIWHVPSGQQTLTTNRIERIRKRGGDNYSKTWSQTWKTLTQMCGLRELIVELNIIGDASEGWTAQELDVVKSVSKPEKFVLVLPEAFAERMVGRVGGDNCQVVSAFEESDKDSFAS